MRFKFKSQKIKQKQTEKKYHVINWLIHMIDVEKILVASNRDDLFIIIVIEMIFDFVVEKTQKRIHFKNNYCRHSNDDDHHHYYHLFQRMMSSK